MIDARGAGPYVLVLVLGLLAIASLAGLTWLWPHFWLVLGLNLAVVFPRRP